MGIDSRRPWQAQEPCFLDRRVELAWAGFCRRSWGCLWVRWTAPSEKNAMGFSGTDWRCALGGIAFDPISSAAETSGAPSRAIGFALIGLATGVAIGIVESALKDRWLYVASGPLAGKQFILYKPITTIGSSQSSDIYLFKDTSILPQHGVIEMRGAQTFVRSNGPVFVSGAPARNRALQSGDLIQIGRYAFHFRERQRK